MDNPSTKWIELRVLILDFWSPSVIQVVLFLYMLMSSFLIPEWVQSFNALVHVWFDC